MENQQKAKQPFLIRLRNTIERRLIAGILVVGPLWVSYIALKFFFRSLDSFFAPIVKQWLPFAIPGMGFILLLIFLYLVGLITANILGRSLVKLWESILTRIPLVKSVYNATKQLIETISAPKTLGFQRAVFIEYPRQGLVSLGFVVNQMYMPDQKKRYVNVFVPTPPNPVTGITVMVPEDQVIETNLSKEEALKFVLSVGIVVPKKFSVPEELEG